MGLKINLSKDVINFAGIFCNDRCISLLFKNILLVYFNSTLLTTFGLYNIGQLTLAINAVEPWELDISIGSFRLEGVSLLAGIKYA